MGIPIDAEEDCWRLGYMGADGDGTAETRLLRVQGWEDSPLTSRHVMSLFELELYNAYVRSLLNPHCGVIKTTCVRRRRLHRLTHYRRVVEISWSVLGLSNNNSE